MTAVAPGRASGSRRAGRQPSTFAEAEADERRIEAPTIDADDASDPPPLADPLARALLRQIQADSADLRGDLRALRADFTDGSDKIAAALSVQGDRMIGVVKIGGAALGAAVFAVILVLILALVAQLGHDPRVVGEAAAGVIRASQPPASGPDDAAGLPPGP